MKRILCLLSIGVFLFAGCSDSNKIAELESRIAELEAENERLTEYSNELAAEQLKNIALEGLNAAENPTNKVVDEDKSESEEAKVIPKISEEEAKSGQLLKVTSADIIVQSTEYKTLYPDMIQPIIENLSDDTVKNFKIGFLAYDENGYPLKFDLGSYGIDDDYEKKGNAEGVNIQPGSNFGKENGYGIQEKYKIKYVLACVASAEFYNNGEWVNPYYDYFINNHKEKPQEIEYLKNYYANN